MKIAFYCMEKFKVPFHRTLQQTIINTCVLFFEPDDGRSKLLRNVGLYLSMYTASYARMYFNKETVSEHLVHIPRQST